MMPDNFVFESCFAPYIQSLIVEKRRAGFQYCAAAHQLKQFDRFCIENKIASPCITKEIADQWCLLQDGEAPATQAGRVSVVRQLSLYMQASGIESYIPRNFAHKAKPAAYVLDAAEVKSLFEQIDAYQSVHPCEAFHRLALEYRILFRVIFCCGLRVSEARKLRVVDVDLKQGILKITQAKGGGDRLVYLPEELRILCADYLKILQTQYHIASEWFFPARNPERVLEVASIGQKFHCFWERTPYAGKCNIHPTVHSLRHTFVVMRMNQWMEEGIRLEAMMPYLSKYLGHASVNDTFYYYHQVESAFHIIREKDTVSQHVIPEVYDYEEKE